MTEPKKQARPLVRSAKQLARIAQSEAEKAAEADLAAAVTKTQEEAAQLAQIVNLHIAGYSLAAIGAAIGASAEEVDDRLSHDTARYVRSQPALRVYVRNWVSERYTKLLEAVWAEATDRNHVEKLENQDRALKILARMEKLHGAAAPVQTEMKIESTPEAVEKLIDAISRAQGKGYDTSIFDVVDAEVVEDAVAEAEDAVVVSGNAVGDSDGHDEL